MADVAWRKSRDSRRREPTLNVPATHAADPSQRDLTIAATHPVAAGVSRR